MIELDGFSHDLEPERDAARDRWFARKGYRVLRFSNDDALRNPEGVLTAIAAEIVNLRLRRAHP